MSKTTGRSVMNLVPSRMTASCKGKGIQETADFFLPVWPLSYEKSCSDCGGPVDDMLWGKEIWNRVAQYVEGILQDKEAYLDLWFSGFKLWNALKANNKKVQPEVMW